MKKLITLILVIFFGQAVHSQNPVQKNDTIVYRHEFGLDATSFIKQFLNLNINGGQIPYPVYYLTYRLHSKKSNLRAGFGGEYTRKNARPSSPSSPSREYDLTKSFYYRVGYEYINKINDRWSIFYGMDLRPSVFYNKNDNINQSLGFTVGTTSNTKTIGLAPLLGARFQINKRLSLSTEVSISFNYSETKSWNFYTSNSGKDPELKT